MKCRYCQKELATDHDYATIPEGEGEHLCWSDFSQPCIDVEEALDIARARIAELEVIIANVTGDRLRVETDGTDCQCWKARDDGKGE